MGSGTPTLTGAALAAAIVWSSALIVLAFVLPVVTIDSGESGVQPRESLASADGSMSVIIVAVPFLATMMVTLMMGRTPRRGGPAFITAWIVAGALTAAALVGTITILIGLFVLPTAVLLIVALTAWGPRAP